MKLRAILIMVFTFILLLIVFNTVRKEESNQPLQVPRTFLWDIEIDDLVRIAVTLPLQDLHEAWVIKEDKYWYFDEHDGPMVDLQRWGGGIPLLLSGPMVKRLIVENAADAQLFPYGLAEPQRVIELGVKNGRKISVELGELTPDGHGHYIKMQNSSTVYTVDATWYDVIERLVLEPPYPDPVGRILYYK